VTMLSEDGCWVGEVSVGREETEMLRQYGMNGPLLACKWDARQHN